MGIKFFLGDRASEASAAGGWDPRWRCQRGAYVVVSGEQITMRSTWVSNRGESPPQTKVTIKQLFDPLSRGGVEGVRPVSGRRLGPQAVSEGGRQGEEAGGRRWRRGGTH